MLKRPCSIVVLASAIYFDVWGAGLHLESDGAKNMFYPTDVSLTGDI